MDIVSLMYVFLWFFCFFANVSDFLEKIQWFLKRAKFAGMEQLERYSDSLLYNGTTSHLVCNKQFTWLLMLLESAKAIFR